MPWRQHFFFSFLSSAFIYFFFLGGGYNVTRTIVPGYFLGM